MADDDKPKKSASEKLYDRKKPEAKKPEDKAPDKPEAKADSKPSGDAGGDAKAAVKSEAGGMAGAGDSKGGTEGEAAADPVAEMRGRHEQERRDLHNGQRKAYRGLADLGTLTAINRQHERAMADMNMRHEAESVAFKMPGDSTGPIGER